MKKLCLFVIASALLCNMSMAQQHPDAPSENKETVRVVETERALQLMEMNIADKSSDFVTVNGTQYRWFPTREKALEYFSQMNIKRDFTIFYIDAKQAALQEPEVITIREKVEIKISE